MKLFTSVGLAILLLLVSLALSNAPSTAVQFAAVGGVVVALLLFYFAPTLEARRVRHANIWSIFVVNLLLGWTLVGWVVAAAWALKRPEGVVVHQATPAESSAAADPQRSCPMCAEKIHAQALKCKHCGSMIGHQQPST